VLLPAVVALLLIDSHMTWRHATDDQNEGHTADTNYLFHQSKKNINLIQKIFFSTWKTQNRQLSLNNCSLFFKLFQLVTIVITSSSEINRKLVRTIWLFYNWSKSFMCCFKKATLINDLSPTFSLVHYIQRIYIFKLIS
jgi:hypothetical protein